MAALLEQLLRRDLRAAATAIDEHALRRRIHDYYLPVFLWTEALVHATQSARAAAPNAQQQQSACVVVGLSCVQGGGKTTVVKYLEELLQLSGKRCATLSLDDVYLTRSNQVALAAANPGNPLLEFRGNPGTQDMELLLDVVRECKTSTGEILVPRYDKSLHGGRGDRAPQSEWVKKQGPVDVLLVEGWCMGFQALKSSDHLCAELRPINSALREFDRLYEQLDGLITIKVGDLDWVYRWREEQEQQLRSAGKPALSPAQVHDFVDRFMPAYRTYLGPLYASAAATVASRADGAGHACEQLVIEIDAHRQPLSVVASERMQREMDA